MTETEDYQKRLLDEYPAPLNYLLVELVMANEEYWLRDEDRQNMYGAEVVREQGLTTNQRRWANEIADNIRKAGG